MATNSDLKVIKNESGSVTLTLIRRDYWGRIKSRKKFTLSESRFNKALLDAKIIAPWNRA